MSPSVCGDTTSTKPMNTVGYSCQVCALFKAVISFLELICLQ